MKLMARLSDVIRRLSPRCKEAARVISDSLDRRPDLLDRTGLFLHVLICAPCRRYQRSVKFLRMKMKQFAKLPAPDPGQSMPVDGRSRIRSVMERWQNGPST